jgi:phage-related protein
MWTGIPAPSSNTPIGDGYNARLPAHRGDAFRVIYVVQLGDALWVVHAFQKKSTQGIKTPKHEVDLIADRIKRLKQMLREV